VNRGVRGYNKDPKTFIIKKRTVYLGNLYKSLNKENIMETEIQERAKRIATYLKENFGAKAIILTGSRFVGDYEEDSDWDMFVFTEHLKLGQARISIAERFGPAKIEGETKLDIYWLPHTQKFDWNVFWLKLRYATIILDTDEIAKSVIDEAKKVYDKGSEKWSDAKFEGEKNRSLGYLKKMNNLIKKDKNGECFKRLCWYYAEYLFDWWFSLRQEWPLRPGQAFDYIKEKDPNFYKQVEQIYSDTTIRQKVDACEKIHQILFKK
tara:strand:+ start:129 stop:923 length:795 start_codon:yes stop_codon:yes gene_type:complete